ncbi:DUF4226 domain-containing protein [Mycolicibacterium mageritense]|uniref:DUF4226 domain-containing protein n=1 Tax=Mycolicibacterium mageritense TaxID=53462 RepID=UPI001E455F85|nr:DUF4226 domain-containing protein [Mycolicibacterium mageritense]MCC9184330.1 DUF4226 domain-containing protein [Mycolicibacterium mageritense]
MSSGAVVRYVDEVLGRAQSLFGQPEASGGSPARSAVSLVNGAGELVRGNATRIAPANGQFAATFTSFTNKAAPALDALAGLDDQLGRTLTDAANTDRTGRNDSGQVRNGAATDTRILGPVSGTPAGERALLVQLKGRLQQQQQVIAAYKARDARLAALVRSLSYRGRGSTGGGGGFSPASFGGIPRGSGGGSPGGGSSIPGLSSLSSLPASFAGMRRGPDVNDSAPIGQLPAGAASPLTPWSSKRRVAARIIWEGKRRGYRRDQIIAILSTALQESNLDPRAIGGGGAWHGIFQQDSGYAGRDDPNQNIAEFFKRLGDKGGPGAGNMYHTIFWLQQRPGEPSAAVALQNGRRAYLSEIMSKQNEAMHLFDSLTAS